MAERRHRRYDFSDTVDYRVNIFGPDTTFRGFILNVSESGLCLYTSYNLSVGQGLTMQTSLKPSPVRAIIRWVTKYQEDLFKVGAEFTE